MAQNVGTPKFFIDHSLFHQAVDAQIVGGNVSGISVEDASKLLQLNPSGGIEYSEYFNFSIPRKMPMNYIAFLGHNRCRMYPKWGSITGDFVYSEDALVINYPYAGADSEYSGFSILEFNDEEDKNWLNVGIEGHSEQNEISRMGAVSAGSTYTMQSPNLSLTMSREYGGTKEFTTYNGSSMSNTMWSKPPMWGELGSWELFHKGWTKVPQALSRTGRRRWDLKFSFMDNHNLWGSNQSLSEYLEILSGYSTDDLGWTGLTYWTPATLTEGLNPKTGNWCHIPPGADPDDYGGYIIPDCWTTDKGIWATADYDLADFLLEFPEFKDGEDATWLDFIIGLGGSMTTRGLEDDLTTTYGTLDWVGTLDTLTAGDYYKVALVPGAPEIVTEAFHTPSLPNIFTNNLLTDSNFFSQVWNKTLGGTLPFIFQPDGGRLGVSNNNPDQFAICRFVNNSLKATQTAFNVYDISVSIEEVW